MYVQGYGYGDDPARLARISAEQKKRQREANRAVDFKAHQLPKELDKMLRSAFSFN